VEFQVPDEFIEAVALRVAAHVSAQAAPEPSRWLNVESTAEYLDTTAEAVRGLVKREQGNGFPVHRRGGRLLFDRGELDAWVRGT
jgi:helix-turn-helix protein